MGVGPRFILVVLFLAVTAGALADGHSDKDAPQEHTTVEESECWGCHKPGAWSPPLRLSGNQAMLQLVPTRIDITDADMFELEVTGVNGWIASNPTNRLLDWRVGLDISGAPSLAFVSDREPFAATLDGTITYDPLAPPTGTSPPQNQPQSGFVSFGMPQGATGAVIIVTPTDTNAVTGPDLAVNIYTGTTEPTNNPNVELSPGGKGQPVVATFVNQDFGELGYGNWTVEAVTTPVPTDGTTPVLAAGEIPFRVDVAAVFDTSAETFALDTWEGGVLPGQFSLFSWDLQRVGEPGLGEALRFTTNVTIHYEHEGSEPDWWEFAMPAVDIPIDVGATGAAIGSDDAGVVLIAVEPVGVSTAAISEAIGYASAFLLIASIYTGGMFGKTSRRQLNALFGNAKRRVAFHNFLSYGIIAAALAHFILFLVEVNYHWALGLIWGGLGILAMFGLGLTGAFQVPMIRRWNYAVWRWSHFYMAIAAIVFTLVHMALDGQNFHFIQDALGYQDPLVPADRQ